MEKSTMDKVYSFRAKPCDMDRVKQFAAERQTSASDIIRAALVFFLEQQENTIDSEEQQRVKQAAA